MQYAVTRGSRCLSSLPKRAASLLAVGSFIRVNWLYTSRPLSSSASPSAMSGFGNSLSFCAVRVVRWGPILDAGFEGGNCNAAPELFRLRSLLFSVDRGPVPDSRDAVAMAVVPVDVPTADEDWPVCGGTYGLRFGGLEVDICGLKVTLRVGLAGGIGLGALEVGKRGDVSDDEAAIVVLVVSRLRTRRRTCNTRTPPYSYSVSLPSSSRSATGNCSLYVCAVLTRGYVVVQEAVKEACSFTDH